ncbi:hypothetical protein ACPC54_41815 [Kitasatospora sp. NPDC094028]
MAVALRAAEDRNDELYGRYSGRLLEAGALRGGDRNTLASTGVGPGINVAIALWGRNLDGHEVQLGSSVPRRCDTITATGTRRSSWSSIPSSVPNKFGATAARRPWSS